jgi:hypothetical protein
VPVAVAAPTAAPTAPHTAPPTPAQRTLRTLDTGARLVLFAVLAAPLLALVTPGAGWNGRTVALAVGMMVALPAVLLAGALPAEIHARRRSGVHARMRVVPAALVLALVTALLSRAAGFIPGYVFGLVIGYAAVRPRPMTRGQEGRGALYGAVSTLLLAVAAWCGLAFLDPPRTGESVALTIGREALTATFVMGVEAVVIGLLPLNFLDGRRLLRWSKAAWAALYVPAAALFSYVLLTQYRTPVEEDKAYEVLLRSVIGFAAFGLAAVFLWAFFEWHGRRERAAA